VDVGAVDILGNYGVTVVDRATRELVIINDVEEFLKWRVANNALKLSGVFGSSYVKIGILRFFFFDSDHSEHASILAIYS